MYSKISIMYLYEGILLHKMLSRREFLAVSAGGLLYAALAAEEAFGAPNRLTDAEISQYMARRSFEDILREEAGY